MTPRELINLLASAVLLLSLIGIAVYTLSTEQKPCTTDRECFQRSGVAPF